MTGLSVAVLPEDGAPRVGITIDGLDPATPSMVTVTRHVDDGAIAPIPELNAARLIGGAFVRDYAVPLNQPVTYRLTVDGPVVPETCEATISITSDVAWLQDPADPRIASQVAHARRHGIPTVVSPSFESMSYLQDADIAIPLGARYPVAAVGPRRMASEIPLEISERVGTDGAMLQNLLIGGEDQDGAGTLMVRGLPAALGLPATTYIVASEIIRQPMAGGRPGVLSLWSLTATVTRGPALQALVPWWTYDNVGQLWSASSYDDARALRPGSTYLDWVRDPEVR